MKVRGQSQPAGSLVSRLWVRLVGLCLSLLCGAWGSFAAERAGAMELQGLQFWIDPSGHTTIDEVSRLESANWSALTGRGSFKVTAGALWMRVFVPPGSAPAPGGAYLLFDGSSNYDHINVFQRQPGDRWSRQDAGDHIPVSSWTTPDRVPVFRVEPAANSPIYLRVENAVLPILPSIRLLDEATLKAVRDRSLFFIGAYLGFGLLVFFLGWVHVRLYGDRVFIAYTVYVAFMLLFQTAYTGLAGYLLWPDWSRWNDVAPSVFVLWLTAAGIWFVREVCSLPRLSRRLTTFVTGWSVFGWAFGLAYVVLRGPEVFKALNLYGFLSVLLSFGVCVWAWRRGERYAGWVALGFLPLHLAYPFPALRTAGLIDASWPAQYATLIGSALEIPLLLYILHRRARDFTEVRERMRVVDRTDPLTGLVLEPVLRLRLADALRRARGSGGDFALVMVELANHAEIVAEAGREMGDRALVVSAAVLNGILRDIDTLCRVANTRFVILLERPYPNDLLGAFAQKVVARGLGGMPPLPPHLSPRFKVVTQALPVADLETDAPAYRRATDQLLQVLSRALDHLEAKTAVRHLEAARRSSSSRS